MEVLVVSYLDQLKEITSNLVELYGSHVITVTDWKVLTNVYACLMVRIEIFSTTAGRPMIG